MSTASTSQVDDKSASSAAKRPGGNKINENAKPPFISDSANLNIYSRDDLRAFTDNFSRNNLIEFTQFGRVYRGKLIDETQKEARFVTIKTWSNPPVSYSYIGSKDINLMLSDEVKFLTLPSMKAHPNLVKLMGFCYHKRMKGVVYDLDPLDTLQNVMTKDDFGWNQRIKVALALARLLKFLHSKGNSYLIQNVDTRHIMLDQDYNAFVFDFGLMSGGIIGEMNEIKRRTPMTPAYCDMYGASTGEWNTYSDVYSFGVIIIELITKRIAKNDDIGRGVAKATDLWALELSKSGKSFDVHPSLQEDQYYKVADGHFLVKLGMRCIEFNPGKRPTMELIVKCLEKLSAVKRLLKDIS